MSSPRSPVSYVGRFAPSPTGPLHFGSLLAAIASFLDARAQQGTWLVRMEDLDPPREPAGAAATILKQLEAFGLLWDGTVLCQSTRLQAYTDILDELQRTGHCFNCTCTRPQIRAMGNVYNGHCRERRVSSAPHSVRLRVCDQTITVEDLVQGTYSANLATQCGDFIIRRKDGLFAYQLAVVADDEYQGITTVVRGYDLLDSTPRQIHMQQVLNFSTPAYGHIPVITDSTGQKLSKQRFAEPIDSNNALQLTHTALTLLGQAPPAITDFADNSALLQWAMAHWHIQSVPKLANINHA